MTLVIITFNPPFCLRNVDNPVTVGKENNYSERQLTVPDANRHCYQLLKRKVELTFI